ncbi:MAG TPA: PAS domain-containing protein [Acidimicrobiia bacterium]|nr:PAS domain-containing protein [Acidimicrobiia bacterium]
MNGKAVELILLRQLLSRLPLPATLVDAEGDVVYINGATERLMGLDYEALGERPLVSWEFLDPRHPDGSPMAIREMPLATALLERRPQQYRMIVHGIDGVPHRIVTTAIPLDGQGGTLLGAMSFFWEENENQEPVLP